MVDLLGLREYREIFFGEDRTEEGVQKFTHFLVITAHLIAILEWTNRGTI